MRKEKTTERKRENRDYSVVVEGKPRETKGIDAFLEDIS